VPALTLLSLVFFFSHGPLEAALPVYSVQTLHANADGYGLLWTGFGAGAFAGVLTLTKLSRRWRPSIALPMIAVLWGALLCPLFFIRQLRLAMLFLGVAGASWRPTRRWKPPCCSGSSRPRYAARSSARGIRWW
jgi:MFS family permease